MRMLITGGAGFIGANLARAALADPAVSEVRVLDDLSTGSTAALAGLPVHLTRGSVLDPTALDAATAGVDAVVHLAALPSVPRSLLDPVASHAANATGTLAVLDAARRHDVGHVVVASSSSVYGANPALPKREDAWTRPLSPYGASKLAAESYTLAYQASFGLCTTAFRFFNVYGPGQRADHAYAAVVPRFVAAGLRREPLDVYGDGRQSRDFTFVGTVCAVLLDSVRRRVGHDGPVNLALGTRVDLLAVVDTLRGVLGHDLDVRFHPERPGDVKHSQADGSVLRALHPGVEGVRLEDGLRATVDWFREPAR